MQDNSPTGEIDSEVTNEATSEGSQDSRKGIASRKTALEALMRIEKSDSYSNLVLSEALAKSGFSKRDKAFVTLLVQGVTRNRTLIDSIIAGYSKKSLEKLPASLLNVLRLGVFQLRFLRNVPPRAVLSTSATLARETGHRGQASYATGILRHYLRDIESEDGEVSTAPIKIETVEELTALAKERSLPVWIAERWSSNYGLAIASELIEHAAKEPRLTLRINETAITTDGYLNIIKNAGIEVRPSTLMPNCLIIESKGAVQGGVESLPGYEEGLFSIQDEASALVSQVVAATPGETIVDLCAAPGGKTMHLAENMEGKGRVIAVDRYEKRLKPLKKSRTRLALSNIETVVADGTSWRPEAPVDKVLVDAPCTGTGVLNKRSDIKYRRKVEDLESLPALQLKLLKNAASMLKPGGVLVYATCSLEPEENQKVIDAFMQSSSEEKGGDFSMSALSQFVPEEFASRHGLSDALASGMLQLLPSMDGISGFFIARLRKDS